MFEAPTLQTLADFNLNIALPAIWLASSVMLLATSRPFPTRRAQTLDTDSGAVVYQHQFRDDTYSTINPGRNICFWRHVRRRWFYRIFESL